MLLLELFDDEKPKQGEMSQRLRQAALDYLIPFVSQNVPFVTINQVIEALGHSKFGLVINRAMVMELLDPQQVAAVSKIDGDRIFLSNPDDKAQELDTDDEQKGKEHVADMALGQIKKTLTEPKPNKSKPQG